jgi:hypothetical protein
MSSKHSHHSATLLPPTNRCGAAAIAAPAQRQQQALATDMAAVVVVANMSGWVDGLLLGIGWAAEGWPPAPAHSPCRSHGPDCTPSHMATPSTSLLLSSRDQTRGRLQHHCQKEECSSPPWTNTRTPHNTPCQIHGVQLVSAARAAAPASNRPGGTSRAALQCCHSPPLGGCVLR